MSHRREPVGYTCPDIDNLIKRLEELRSDNDQLRTWGTEEATRVDELEQVLLLFFFLFWLSTNEFWNEFFLAEPEFTEMVLELLQVGGFFEPFG